MLLNPIIVTLLINNLLKANADNKEQENSLNLLNFSLTIIPAYTHSIQVVLYVIITSYCTLVEKTNTIHFISFNLCATTDLLHIKVHRTYQTRMLRSQERLTMMCLTRKLSLLTTTYTRGPNNLYTRYLFFIQLLKSLHHSLINLY